MKLYKFNYINFLLALSVLFSNPILNTGNMAKTKPNKIEPNTQLDVPIQNGNFEPVLSRSLNSTFITNSMNGYGLVSPQTRPIDNNDNQWVVAYRQYNGDENGSGQIGVSWSEDVENSEEWTSYDDHLNLDLNVGRLVVGNTGQTAVASNGAILPASFTTTARDALTVSAGMIIFNTTVNKHQGYDGTNWNNLY